MNMLDILIEHEELMTPEEREEWSFHPSQARIESPPRWFVAKTDMLATPDEYGRKDFLQRKPALGFSLQELDMLQDHFQDSRLLRVQKHMLFKMLKSVMLMNLISTNGATTFAELLQLLRDEIETKTPAPIPKWYEFSPMRFGPRRLGYRACEASTCSHTETVDVRFMQCSKCQLASYCCRDCQAADWKMRHKVMCKEAREQKLDASEVGMMLPEMLEKLGMKYER